MGQGGAQKPAEQNRAIPIRNLATPKPKEKNLVVRIATTAAVVVALGAGGYFGFIWVKGIQDKNNAKSHADEERNSGESQVGHIANLNNMLDATEPGHYPGESRGRSVGPKARSTGVGEEIAVPASDGGAAASSAAAAMEKQMPVVPPTYTLEASLAKIPEGRVNGMVAGTNFVADMTRVDPSASAQILRFIQGQPTSPDREMLVYLHLKPGEKLGGQVVNVTSDMHGAGVPSVAKRWKTNPRYAPSPPKFFSSGYAMKLELGPLTNGIVPGKIYLALPDPEQSVIAGMFMATVPAVDMTMMQAPTPAAVPTAGNAANAEAMRKRYGLGK